MTTTTIETTTPAPPRPSRLAKAIAQAERATPSSTDAVADYVEDFTTADERLAAFWRKYKDAEVDIDEKSTRVDLPNGGVEWTVRVTIEAENRTVAASATRSSEDPNPIVAGSPHETAQTAALSRAIRFLGIKLQSRSTKS